ncbi:hypothetical protein IID20_01135 [Patescibacteria group bacterium]|nr:hypothetical protein [Patescibacteria group bacterium]
MSFERLIFLNNLEGGQTKSRAVESVELKKKIKWEKEEKEVDQFVDSLGEKVDEQIKEAIVAFNVMGLPTTASCEGHIDRGMSAPWIEISDTNQPVERFINERAIIHKIAEKYGVSVEDIKRAKEYDAYLEAVKEYSKNDETLEYKQWRERNQKLERKAQYFLAEFYKNRKVDSNIRLIISVGGEGEFRVHNGGKDYQSIKEQLNDQEKKELDQRLTRYQEEMKKLARFLREQYFSL